MPGDKIFAFVTASSGTKIHRTDCPNAANIISRYPYRVVNAVWKQNSESKTFNAKLHIEGVYQPGASGSITKLISETYRIHIRSFNFSETDNGRFSVTVVVLLNSKSQQDFLVEQLKSIKFVDKVGVEKD